MDNLKPSEFFKMAQELPYSRLILVEARRQLAIGGAANPDRYKFAWQLHLAQGTLRSPLRSARGNVREWTDLNRAVGFIRSRGLHALPLEIDFFEKNKACSD